MKRVLKKAHEFSYYDELTGLANRRLLVERFNRASARAKRHQQKLLLLFLDVDDFKRINDEFGHSTGDLLLRLLAKRLCKSVRSTDTVGRYGGDEFIVMLTGFQNYDDALAAVEKLCAILSMPYDVDGASIPMSISHGSAVYPDGGHAYPALVQQSDTAMYQCKNRKRISAG